MAGPSIVNVSSVVDPFEGLQKAVSNVGDIYSDYDRETRETASHNAAVRDSNRVQEQRDFNRAYDPQLAIEGRGLTANTKKLYDAKEKEVAAHYQKIRDKGGKIPSAEELNTGLRDIRNSLITKEDAADVVRRDYLDQGFSPEEANKYAEVNTAQYTSRADMLGGETSRVDALNAQRQARSEAAEVTANLIIDSEEALSLTDKQRASLGIGQGKSTNWNGKDYSASALGDSDLAARTQLLTTMKESLGDGIPLVWGGDAKEAINMADKAFYGFNKTRVDAGLPPLPYSVLEKFMMAKTDSTLGDRDTIYNDADGMRAGMDTEWANYIPKNKDWNGTSSKGKEKDSKSIVPQAYYNRINDTTQVAPRSMSQLEVIKINRLFSSYGMDSAPSNAAPKTERLPALDNESESGGKADSGGGKQSLEEAKARAASLEQKKLDALAKDREIANAEVTEKNESVPRPLTGNSDLPPSERSVGVFPEINKEGTIDNLARWGAQQEIRTGNAVREAEMNIRSIGSNPETRGALRTALANQEDSRETYDTNATAVGQDGFFPDDLSQAKGRYLGNWQKQDRDQKISVQELNRNLGRLEKELAAGNETLNNDRVTTGSRRILSGTLADIQKKIDANKTNSGREAIKREDVILR
jgi:hypothetical protein